MQILSNYSMQFIGKPYVYGGELPAPPDCSALCQELLRSCGEDPAGDQTAQGLFDWFNTRGRWNVQKCGALVFYGSSAKNISHVAMLLDPYRVVEAGGGDSTTRTEADAMKRPGAMVRVRLMDHRKDRVAIIRPHYALIGEL